jgi:hypothetical protein
LQKADVNFVGLILHGMLRFSSAGLAGGKDDDRSDDQGNESEREDDDGLHGQYLMSNSSW